MGFEWRAKIQNLAGPGVELPGNGVAFVLGEAGHRGVLWQVLADEAVGVLGGAALPGVIGLGEVEYDPGQALEPRVVMKLGTIVGREGQDAQSPDHDQEHAVDLGHGLVEEFADHQKACTPVHEGEDALLGPWSVNQVYLKMPPLKPPLRGRRPLRDIPFTPQNTAAVAAPVGLATSLATLAQVFIEVAARTAVLAKIPVNGLMADPQDRAKTQH